MPSPSSKLAALRQKRQQLTENIIPHVINAGADIQQQEGGADTTLANSGMQKFSTREQQDVAESRAATGGTKNEETATPRNDSDSLLEMVTTPPILNNTTDESERTPPTILSQHQQSTPTIGSISAFAQKSHLPAQTPSSYSPVSLSSPQASSSSKSPSSRLSQLRLKKEILSQKSTQIMASSAPTQNPLITHLQTQISTQKEKMSELEMQLESMQLERDIAVEELELLRETMENEHDNDQQQQQQNSDAMGMAAVYNQKITTLESEVSRLHTEKKQLKTSLSSTNERLDLLQNSELMIENISNRNTQLEEKLHAYETQLNDLRELVEMSEEMESIHTNEMDMMREELQQKEEILDNMQRELQASRRELSDREQLIVKYREKLAKLEQQQATLSPRNTPASAPAKSVALSPVSPLASSVEYTGKLYHSLLSARLSHQLTMKQAKLLTDLLSEVSNLLPAAGELGQQQHCLLQVLNTSNSVKLMLAKLSTLSECLVDSASNNRVKQGSPSHHQHIFSVDATESDTITLSFSHFHHYLASYMTLLRFLMIMIYLRLENAPNKDEYEERYRSHREVFLSVEEQLDTLVDKFQQQTLSEANAARLIREELFSPLMMMLVGISQRDGRLTFGAYQLLLDLCLQSQKRLKVYVEDFQSLLRRLTKMKIKGTGATPASSSGTTKKTPRVLPLIAPPLLETSILFLNKVNHTITEISQVCRKHRKHILQVSPMVFLPQAFQKTALPQIEGVFSLCMSLEEILRQKTFSLKEIARVRSGKDSDAKAEKKAALETHLKSLLCAVEQIEEIDSSGVSPFFNNAFSIMGSLFAILTPASDDSAPCIITPAYLSASPNFDAVQAIDQHANNVDALNDSLGKIVGLYQMDVRQFDTFRDETKLKWIQDMKKQLEETPVLHEALTQKNQLIDTLQQELEQSRRHLSQTTIQKSKLDQQVRALKESASTFSDIKQRMQSLQDMEDQIEQLTLSNKRYEKAVEELKSENISIRDRHNALVADKESRQQEKTGHSASFDSTRFFHMQRSYETLYKDYLRMMNQRFSRKMTAVMAHSKEQKLRNQQQEEMCNLESRVNSARRRYCTTSAATTIVSLKRPNDYKEVVTDRLKAKRSLRELGVYRH